MGSSAVCLKLCGKYIYVAQRRRLGQAFATLRLCTDLLPRYTSDLENALLLPRLTLPTTEGPACPASTISTHLPFQASNSSTCCPERQSVTPHCDISRLCVGVVLVLLETCSLDHSSPVSNARYPVQLLVSLRFKREKYANSSMSGDSETRPC